MPTRKLEAWRTTNLRLLFGDDSFCAPDAAAVASVTKADLAGTYVAAAEGAQLVFVDGIYAPELSDTAALEAVGG